VDRTAILTLNNAHAADTSFLTAGRLDALLDMAFHIGLVDGGRTGFLLALTDGAAYDSPNYRWFAARWQRFGYVDRIVVAREAWGKGHARRLYQALFAASRAAGHLRIGCEVNVDPPNAGSLAFHARLGFTPLADRTLPGGKVVRYFERRLLAA
jgi:predicted GNAT superfamily acetyltransferase